MKFCHKCGNSLSDDAKFCPGCGTQALSDTPGSSKEASPEAVLCPVQNEAPEKSKTKAVLISIIGVFAVIICVLTVLIVINLKPSDNGTSEEKTTRGHNTVSESDERTTARAETTTREPLTASTEKLPEVPSTQSSKPTKKIEMHLEYDDPYSGYNISTIDLYDDYTFSMTVNLYEGYGNITGTYNYRMEGSIICYVTYKDFSGFTGDELSEFSIVSINDYHYVNLHNVQQIGALETGSGFTYR